MAQRAPDSFLCVEVGWPLMSRLRPVWAHEGDEREPFAAALGWSL
jgi:hypothetical protein